VKDIGKIIRTVKEWVAGSIVLGLMLIIWIEAYIIISQTKVYTIIPRVKDSLGDYDLPALLFGAASLAFFAISFFMVILSFIGWGEIKHKIEELAKSALRDESNELVAGIRTSVGSLFGAIAIKKSDTEISIDNPEYLAYAINICQSAVTLMESLKEKSPNLYIAINNYLFFVALGGKASDGPMAKKYALELIEMPEAIGDTDVQNTYARVVATYSEYFDSPMKAILHAKKMLDSILASETVTELDKKNAQRHVAALDRALKLRVRKT
jgi:hypothetical protein